MAKLQRAIKHMRHLDELSQLDSPMHRLESTTICLTTLLFMIVVASSSPMRISGLIVLFIYPIVIAILSDIPLPLFWKRLLLAEPFVIGIAIFQPILDHRQVLWNGFATTVGWLSFASILIKSTLTISAALLLIAIIGIHGLSSALRAFHVPAILVTQIQLTYRYITLLLEEVYRIQTAYALRAPDSKGVALKAWGSLVGMLLIRSHRRADRIYSAMLLRGFHGEFQTPTKSHWTWPDWLWLSCWSAFLIAATFVDIPAWLGYVITGGMQ